MFGTVIDGRDPSIPHFVGFTDWAAVPFALDDLERMEFVRGPAAALYGAGAFNGVLSLTDEGAPGQPRRQGASHRRRARHPTIRRAARGGIGPRVGPSRLGGGFQESADFARLRVDREWNTRRSFCRPRRCRWRSIG